MGSRQWAVGNGAVESQCLVPTPYCLLYYTKYLTTPFRLPIIKSMSAVPRPRSSNPPIPLHDRAIEDLTFGYGGWAPALEAPGLGVRIDTAAVERLKVREEHWTIS